MCLSSCLGFDPFSKPPGPREAYERGLRQQERLAAQERSTGDVLSGSTAIFLKILDLFGNLFVGFRSV